jgi:hypothetical protein
MLVLFILSVLSCMFNWLLLGKSGEKDIEFSIVQFITAILSIAIVFHVYVLSGRF